MVGGPKGVLTKCLRFSVNQVLESSSSLALTRGQADPEPVYTLEYITYEVSNELRWLKSLDV